MLWRPLGSHVGLQVLHLCSQVVFGAHGGCCDGRDEGVVHDAVVLANVLVCHPLAVYVVGHSGLGEGLETKTLMEGFPDWL